MSDRDGTGTLKGLGPKVPLSEIENSAHYQRLRREVDRYEWLKAQIESEPLCSVWEYLEPLRSTEARHPGAIEASLVALSVHPHPFARLVLSSYQSPEELRLFHIICRDERLALD